MNIQFAKVMGTVVATRKYHRLEGVKFYVIQPMDHSQKPLGEPVIAADTVNSNIGDTVIYISKREASLACPDQFVPVDDAIIGIVDDINVEATL